MNNRVGFDLNNAHFYVYGSNVENVMTVGSSLLRSTIRLYADANSNASSDIGLDATTPPTLWLGNTLPVLYVKDNKVGINNPNPTYPLDVSGDMRLSGTIVQAGTNTSIVTQMVESDHIQVNSISSGNSEGINFNGSSLYNISSITANSNITVNVFQQYLMNGTQQQQVMKTTGVLSTRGTHTSKVRLAWDAGAELFDPTFEAEVTFFASGNMNTRMHLKANVLINIASASIDVVTHKSTFQSDNVQELDLYVEHIAEGSLYIGATWRLSNDIDHKGHIKIDVTAPTELGYISMNI